MTEREKAISYLSEGHALLKAHGLYGASDEAHFFALVRALKNFEKNGEGTQYPAEAAAALQALYEARRLVTARSAIEGRRIILGDWFMSLAVGLALPLRSPGLTALLSEELCRIGADANRISFRATKKDFCATVDRITEALCSEAAAPDGKCFPALKTPGRINTLRREPLEPHDNKLLSALEGGFYKTAAAEVRSALSQMEAFFTEKYSSAASTEMDGWIYGAIMSGGKRLRPILVRLCAGLAHSADRGLCDDAGDTIINIMSIIELMHSASLVHDDIVDRSPMRRSRATINAEKGDGYAAMCGFKMIADALVLITDDIPERIPAIIAGIPKEMCGGELGQLDIENKPELQSEEEYFRRIACKTAALIEGSCVCGAAVGGGSGQIMNVASDYGRALGLLFQLRDDLLDYGTASGAGKPVAQDMERGIYSLPLLHARKILQETDPKEAAKLDAVLRKYIKSPADFAYLNETAEKTGGIAYTAKAIGKQADAALSALALLPPGPYTEALGLLVTSLSEIHSADRDKLGISSGEQPSRRVEYRSSLYEVLI